jgi:hypothetical protein
MGKKHIGMIRYKVVNTLRIGLERKYAKDEPGQHWLKLVQWFQKIFEIVYTRQTDRRTDDNKCH